MLRWPVKISARSTIAIHVPGLYRDAPSRRENNCRVRDLLPLFSHFHLFLNVFKLNCVVPFAWLRSMLQPLIVMCQVFNGILVHFADCDSDITELFSDATTGWLKSSIPLSIRPSNWLRNFCKSSDACSVVSPIVLYSIKRRQSVQ